MDRQDIYNKTARGVDEIKNRKYKLPQTERSLLIMIDGTKSIGAFLDQAAALGDVGAMLTDLEKQGFIVKTAAVAPPAPPPEKIIKPGPEKEHAKSPSAGAGGLVDVASMFTLSDEEEKKEGK